MSFRNTSEVTISGGVLTNVGRDQYQYRWDQPCIRHLQIVKKRYLQQTRKGKGKGIRTSWDNYKEVGTGEVYLVDAVGKTAYIEQEKDTRSRDTTIEARRSFYKAVIGEERKEYLYVKYEGYDALKAFRRDFEKYSREKDVHIAQLFGYNKSDPPALIFYDALVPVARIFEQNHLSPILYTYFSHQSNSMAIKVEPRTALGSLWIDSTSGALRIGPHIEITSERRWDIFAPKISTAEDRNGDSSCLGIQTYSDNDSILEFLCRTTTAQNILHGIRCCSTTTGEWVTNAEAVSLLSHRPGTIYNLRTREILARCRDVGESWFYELYHIHDASTMIWDTRAMMKDRAVRFTVTSPMDIQLLNLRYELCPTSSWATLTGSWLSQAHGVVEQVDPRFGEPTIGGFGLLLRPENIGSLGAILEKTPLYLFIRPIPRPSDPAYIWTRWMGGQKYFWSFDPCSEEPMSQESCKALGIPDFTCTIQIWHDLWDHIAYEAVEKLQEQNGLNARTADFARALGLPILDVAAAECDQIWELENSTLLSAPSTDADSEANDSSDSDTDEEIIVYPVRCK
ncbi:hypothetical protein VNI00_006637 [Paramarasmius palmivorus]|uniref:Uncharacterized protein n=1 Tax=Paramarasmius palmivorus TaxID=297713 RepID=A0AAW0D4H1_9AGAR